jgi:hypothetical protein
MAYLTSRAVALKRRSVNVKEKIMAANKFVLKGSRVEVDYTIGITPGLPALVYKAGAFQKSFTSSQILSNDTGLGELVSSV